MSKISITIFTLIMANSAQAILPYSVFNPQARIESLSEENYRQTVHTIKKEEKVFFLELENASDEKTAHLAFCNMLEHQFERFSLASANLEYEIAYQDFMHLRREILLTLQSKNGMRFPCY
ncbi:hypothetical protein HI850_009835 [bacterium SPL81]|nr:hypothetical protein [Acinetobacter baumannii]